MINPEPKDISTDSLGSVYFYDDSPGDKTIRPMGPEIPRGWQRRPQRPKTPPTDQPPADQS